MKSKVEIEFKIAVHESKINDILHDKEEWSSLKSELLNNYLMGRTALRWVLSSDDSVSPDEFEKKVKFEIACYESTKIF
jgi:hypothetical protein